MAKFTGTLNEFDRFIGPRLRNVVQTSLGRKHRNYIGKCEMCPKTDDLHAAHMHGTDRKSLIKEALGDNCINEKIEDVDLAEFERKFKELHIPPERIFKILCRQCHREYDNVKEIFTLEDFSENSITTIDINNTDRQVLPIEFSPNDLIEFKELLLVHRRAKITVFYNGGNKEVKEWNALKISEESDIIRNLRSRLEFRQGNWQEANIKSIKVEISEIV